MGDPDSERNIGYEEGYENAKDEEYLKLWKACAKINARDAKLHEKLKRIRLLCEHLNGQDVVGSAEFVEWFSKKYGDKFKTLAELNEFVNGDMLISDMGEELALFFTEKIDEALLLLSTEAGKK